MNSEMASGRPMKKLIGVIGARECSAQALKMAYEVGKEIAKSGFGLVCGGMQGVMQEAARGCKEAGGLTVGIIPGDDPQQANPFIDIVIPSGLGIMRNLLIVRSAEGLIAIEGAYGTLSEIAFALQLQKPVVGLNTWDIADEIIKAETAEEALKKLLRKIL